MSDNVERREGVNPTVAFITIGALVALAVLGATTIILVNPDAVATFTNNIIIIIGLAITFAGTVGFVTPIARRTARVEKTLQKVEAQTNGRLTSKDVTIDEKDARIRELENRVIIMGGNPHE